MNMQANITAVAAVPLTYNSNMSLDAYIAAADEQDHAIIPVAIPEEDITLEIDMVTGEVVGERELPDETQLPDTVVRPLEDCRDRYEVLEWAQEDSRRNMAEGQSHHKLRWTNTAMDMVLMQSGLTMDQAQKFISLCDLIVTRNVILENHTREIAEHLGMLPAHIGRFLNKLEAEGLLRFYRKNVFKRGRHILLINPAVCWRGYFHAGGNDIAEEGIKPYSSTGFFSRAHRKATEDWVSGGVSVSCEGQGDEPSRYVQRSNPDEILERASLNWIDELEAKYKGGA